MLVTKKIFLCYFADFKQVFAGRDQPRSQGFFSPPRLNQIGNKPVQSQKTNVIISIVSFLTLNRFLLFWFKRGGEKKPWERG